MQDNIEIYYKEEAPVIMEAEEFQGLQLASWGPRELMWGSSLTCLAGTETPTSWKR